MIALKAKSVATLCQNLIQTRSAETALLIVEGAYIQLNRAILVASAREHRCTHVFYMDHDMDFPGDTVDRLLAHDLDVVGGKYNQRSDPPRPTVYLAGPDGQRVPEDQLPTELFRCESIGCGCMLVRLSVFDKIDSPWFNLLIEDNVNLIQTEDVWFCNQVRKAGLEVWCDPTIPVGHLGEKVY